MATNRKLIVGATGPWEWWVFAAENVHVKVAGPFETREAALAARALMEGS